MTMLQDPEMEDVVIEFCDESDQLCQELEQILDDYEEDLTQTALLENFGQIIDRIMGAAKSLDAELVGRYCELGKIVSYKASQTTDVQLLEIVSATLFDTIDILNSIFKNIRTNKEEKVDGIGLNAFASRLKWLSEKFNNIQRSSVAVEEQTQGQDSIDNLLNELGL